MVRLLQDFPCYNCICVPICRHKAFHNLYHDCSLICQLFQQDYEDVYLDLQIALKPTPWKVEREDKFKVVSRNGEDNYA